MRIIDRPERVALLTVLIGSLTCGAPADPFNNYDFPTLPPTWYCVSDWGLEPEKQQRGVELFAWAMFVAVNWPGTLAPQSERWRSTYRMEALNEPHIFPQWIDWYTHAELRRALTPKRGPSAALEELPPVNAVRITSEWSCADGECPRKDLIGPGFAAAPQEHRNVYDQAGTPLRYEVRVNETTSEGLHRALSRDSDKSEKRRPITLSLTRGQCKDRGPTSDSYTVEGATNLKLAWKVLTPAEAESGRFLRRRIEAAEGCVGADCPVLEFGLVGMHIAQFSKHYSDWVWATFEHVDNLTGVPGSGDGLRDNGCDGATCCPNSSLEDPATGLCKTQVAREPLAPEVQALNDRVQSWLAAKGSVLRHYELIGVQFRPYTPDKDKPEPLPTTLRNATIETYHAPHTPCDSTRKVCGEVANGGSSSCLGCHNTVRHHDRTFVVERALCDCDRDPWVNDRCSELLECPVAK